VNPHVSILEEFEEEIIFIFSDDSREDGDEDVLMEIKLCTPFGTLLFPHHGNVSLKLHVKLSACIKRNDAS